MTDDHDRHPLLTEAPAWLVGVPLDQPPQTWVAIGGDRSVPAGMLIEALEVECGSVVTSFSIAPELAQAVAEFTERADWKNLPTEPTTVARMDADVWAVRVGEHEVALSRQEIETALADAMRTKFSESD